MRKIIGIILMVAASLFVSCSDGSDDEVIAGRENTQVQTSNTGWWKYDDSNTVVWLYYSGNVNEPYRVGNSEKEYKENSLTQAKALYLFNNEQVFKNLTFCEDWRSIPSWAFKEPGSFDVKDTNGNSYIFFDSSSEVSGSICDSYKVKVDKGLEKSIILNFFSWNCNSCEFEVISGSITYDGQKIVSGGTKIFGPLGRWDDPNHTISFDEDDTVIMLKIGGKYLKGGFYFYKLIRVNPINSEEE